MHLASWHGPVPGWWWGWTLAEIAYVIEDCEWRRRDYHRWVGHIVNVARNLRASIGHWPTEIQVPLRSECPVRVVSVHDLPPVSDVFCANFDPSMTVEVVDIHIGQVAGLAPGVWGYRSLRTRGEMREFYPTTGHR